MTENLIFISFVPNFGMFLVHAVLPYSVSMIWNPRLDYLHPQFCSAVQVRCAKKFQKNL